MFSSEVGGTRARLVRETAWMTASNVVRVALQAVTFVVVARTLGAHEFGVFVAVLAIVSILGPLAAAGTGNVLVMRTARDRTQLSRCFGTAMLAIPAAGVPLAVAATAAAALLVPAAPAELVVALCGAELALTRIVDVATQAFQATLRLRAAALTSTVVPLTRAGAAVALVAAGAHTAETWSALYLVSAAAAASVAVAAVTVALGRPAFQVRGLVGEMRVGGHFALAQASATVYNDADKALLPRLADAATAGVYGAAYRVTALALVPVTSLLQASYARFFQVGERGLAHSSAFARELLRPTVLYASAAALALASAAPVLPRALGDDFAPGVDVVRALAVLPLLQSLVYLAGDALSGAGHQRIRSWLQLAAAAVNVGMNVVLIPTYGWKGAVVATYVSLGALALALRAAATLLGRHPQPEVDSRARARLARV